MLTGKKVIITGGSRGIGFVIAEEMIKNGAKIVICSRTKSELYSAIKRLNRNGENAYGIRTDVSQLKQCERLIKFALQKLGTIDILINNAGIYGPIGPLEENNDGLWLETIKTNIISMVYCSKLVIPTLKKKKMGKIINLSGSGVGGNRVKSNFSAYFTSKIAVVGFSEVLAEELKSYNIQVNSIAPGAVNTRLTEYLLKQDPNKVGLPMYEETLRQRKTGGTTPILIAKLVAFLSSDRANKITGRYLSARWDKIEQLENRSIWPPNLYKLRRIDYHLFYEREN